MGGSVSEGRAGGLEWRVYAGKYTKEETGKVGLRQPEDLEATAMSLPLSKRTWYPHLPVLSSVPPPDRPWLP